MIIVRCEIVALYKMLSTIYESMREREREHSPPVRIE